MFHPLSLVIPFLILLPNLMFIGLQPRNKPNEEDKGNPIFSVAEAVGRVGVFLIPLFSSIHIDHFYEVISLIGMIVSLSLYYLGWIRYVRGDREYSLLFAPMFGIPVPLAISPVLYFLFAAVVLHSPYLFACGVIFAIGHILSSLSAYNKDS
ncbi:hypothetical protein J2Z22_004747 [Paenibacillus forsythiae]|uniref:Uncharacterized protein n=1 Tax=Paenibacillus forsythiae TaxID=365616 RepID=A0ABU3HE94_9BACL|nr:hypothetical protein [Paenibacillus forsythiae]MDT3429147.1 hypothetical protein [Paenibacillus forsythiae]